ncbi:MAG: hypothetical protein A2016_09405 [Elusimicrobia bacterium GWF2_62_30]|nr:MAG: hypothetical protein A2016_09405 [Elusimicrobia bacterium GWF2_62_30]
MDTSTIAGDLWSETTNRSNADNALSGRLDAVDAATNTIAGNLSAELVARGAADNALSVRQDAVAIDTSAIAGSLATEITDRGTAVTNESNARISADSGLTSRLDTVAVDTTTLAGSLATEITDRGTAITNEANARIAADSALGGRLDTVAVDTSSLKEQVDVKISSALAPGSIFVGSDTGVAAAISISGDATVNSAGLLTVANFAISDAKINDVGADKITGFLTAEQGGTGYDYVTTDTVLYGTEDGIYEQTALTEYARILLGAIDGVGAAETLGLTIGTNVQAFNANLDDLSDGSLTGSLVGPGVLAENIAAGSLPNTVIVSSIAVGAINDPAQVASATISLDKLSQSGCGDNQIPKWNGSGWACAADNNADAALSARLDTVAADTSTLKNQLDTKAVLDANTFTGANSFSQQSASVPGVSISSGLTVLDGAISLNSGTSPINIGADAAAKMINIGTGNAASAIKLGSAGTYFTAIGTCAIASTALSTTPADYTCAGIPAAADLAVTCSGASAMSANATAVYCRATGAADQVSCNTSAANTTSMTWKCMWLQ